MVLGGRIEVPVQGVVTEVPEGWYAFDLTHPDLLAEMATFDETTQWLAADLTGSGFGWPDIEIDLVQVSAGMAHRQDRSGGEAALEEEVSYHLVEADQHVWLQCIDAFRHDDDWLSIAETFELLTAGE